MSKDLVISQLEKYTNSNTNIRAVVLTSSRAASSTAPSDVFSDYDICLYANNISSFLNDSWLDKFGDVLVKWPLLSEPVNDGKWLTRLVLFESRHRIDFQITDDLSIVPADYDLGYEVIVDKDGITNSFPEPTGSHYLIQKPTEEVFLERVNAFFWDATYVPKYLWREELFFAKYMLDYALRVRKFEQMIEWYIGLQHDWSVTTNKHGRYFKKYLDEAMWNEIKLTFAGASIEDNWKAFFKMVGLYTGFARLLAEKLDYRYPHVQEKKMMKYFEKSKDLKSSYGND